VLTAQVKKFLQTQSGNGSKCFGRGCKPRPAMELRPAMEPPSGNGTQSGNGTPVRQWKPSPAMAANVSDGVANPVRQWKSGNGMTGGGGTYPKIYKEDLNGKKSSKEKNADWNLIRDSHTVTGRLLSTAPDI